MDVSAIVSRCKLWMSSIGAGKPDGNGPALESSHAVHRKRDEENGRHVVPALMISFPGAKRT